jgi:Asp-tRNA(Asn)/Glu-tRNA(Gln) amidotransferase A subunit family amidase
VSSLTVESALHRIRTRNHEVRAVLRFEPRFAQRRLELVDSSSVHGALHRVPYVLKDVWDVAGLPTTSGTWRHRDRIAATSSPVQLALEEAGAVMLGKSNLSDLGMTPESDNSIFGPVCNPHDLSRTSGGSTGGAAAVADGMAAFDWGTDLGGSIRIPAAFCGVAGVRLAASAWPTQRPSWASGGLGLVGVGPLAATVRDCRSVLTAAYRLSEVPRSQFRVRGVVLLEPDAFSVGEWPTFAADARALFGRLDHLHDHWLLQPARLPPPREIDRAFASLIGSHLEVLFAGSIGATARAAFLRLVLGELVDVPEMHRHTAQVLLKLLVARFTVYRSRRVAEERLAEVRSAAKAHFDAGELIVTPTTTFAAPRHGEAVFAQGIQAFVKLGNVIDATAVAIPFGRFASGLPRSIQLLGPAGAEDVILDIAQQLDEEARVMSQG